MPNGTTNALQVLASAVTPVVLVSATAILISGVNSRHISISDRMRTLSTEYRDVQTNEGRRTMIERQMWMFKKRIHLVSWAIRNLYAAAWCFVAEVLIISATLWRDSLVGATVPLFLVGIVLIMVAIAMQLLELHVSNRTLFLEVGEVMRLGKTERGEDKRHRNGIKHY
jgi:DNA-binding transcriptional regulator YbjK